MSTLASQVSSSFKTFNLVQMPQHTGSLFYSLCEPWQSREQQIHLKFFCA
uniref:Uncharacterized protein n=1 Tax=Anguilla anguilla TaxID=7936 RepID=A0A0E9W646_ANGAN